MFVLQGKEARAEIRDQTEMDAIISALESKNYKPVLRAMLKAACEAVDVPANKLKVTSLSSDPRLRRRPSSQEGPLGDILSINDHLYLINPQSKRLYVWEIRLHSSPSELDLILQLIEQAVKQRLDGRRVRGMSFDWKEAKSTTRRRFVRPGRGHVDRMTTKKPEYTEEQLNQAKAIVNGENRGFLLSLAQAGKARSKDAAAISNEKVTEELLKENLIRKEYLVICKQDSRTLCSVPEKEHLESEIGKSMTCTTCGRHFKDELVQEIYALTEEARTLINGSHWMTIWVTELLKQSGVSIDSIKWNAAAGDDELDIVADIQGMTVFFELKDREFGLGDAYPFSFRIERYGGDVGVVLTMDKVASEAQKFISEQSSRRTARIEAIEGKNGINKDLPKLINDFSRSSVELFFWDYTEELGIAVTPLINEWLRQKMP